MALYDRDYVKNDYETQENTVNMSAFVKQVYQLFAASLLLGGIGAYVGLANAELMISMYWGLVILEIGLLIGLYFVKTKPGINLAVLFAFTFVSGLALTPILVRTLSMAGGASIVGNAFILTSVAFAGLSIFAMKTDRDFSSMGKMLFITLIVVIVASIINIFFGSPILQLAIASIAAVLFSAFILYDTQNIINGAYSTPIEGAIALYLDFLNLFIALLQILGIMGSSDD
jgi:modulator of FtsH protease